MVHIQIKDNIQIVHLKQLFRLNVRIKTKQQYTCSVSLELFLQQNSLIFVSISNGRVSHRNRVKDRIYFEIIKKDDVVPVTGLMNF